MRWLPVTSKEVSISPDLKSQKRLTCSETKKKKRKQHSEEDDDREDEEKEEEKEQ
jgi:hypothetical protein